ncbi:MAG: hypothetical protein K2X93_04955 [Candidatus Obscuribacterales bacterium]|nr:hypothetical protein [Candidatus Obscuribacterales bacterium]
MTIDGGREKGVEGPVKSDVLGSSLGLGATSPSFNKLWEVATTKPNTATTLPGFELIGASDSEKEVSTKESGNKKNGYEVALNKSESSQRKGTSIYKEPEPAKPKEGKKEGEKSKAKDSDERAKKDDSRDSDDNTPPQDDAARGLARVPEILPAGSKPINNGAK